MQKGLNKLNGHIVLLIIHEIAPSLLIAAQVRHVEKTVQILLRDDCS